MIVWLASYPRSGNTLVRMVLHYRYGITTHSIYDDPNFDEIGASETVGHAPLPAPFEELHRAPDTHYVKTHDLPPDDESPALYIVRDGRAALVSFTRFRDAYGSKRARARALAEGEAGFQERLREFIESTEYGGWSGNVLGWLNRPRGAVAVLHYERLIEDPVATIESAAGVLGIDLADERGADLPSFADLHRRWPKFFRTGLVDSWRTEMSEELCELFWRRHGEGMRAAGYERDLAILRAPKEAVKDASLMSINLSYQGAPSCEGGSYTSKKLEAIRLPKLEGTRFLDLGCNAGFYCGYAHSEGAARVLGIDADPDVVALAREQHPEVEFRDTGWDDFPDEEFDVVICLSAIHYAKDLRLLASNIRAHLADEGLFVLEAGMIDVGGSQVTDIPIPVWREVGDRCRHLTRGFVERHLLREFEWETVGGSEMRGGDPIPRVVIHARPGPRRAADRSYHVDLLEYARCLALSAETISPELPSHAYVSELARPAELTYEDLERILGEPAHLEAFVDDLAFALGGETPARLRIHGGTPAALVQSLSVALRGRAISVVSADLGCATMAEVLPRLAELPNNRTHGTLAGKAVAILGIDDPQLTAAVLEQGPRCCYLVGASTVEVDDERLIALPSARPWDAALEEIDVALFDARELAQFDHVGDVAELAASTRRMLTRDGALFAVLLYGPVSHDMDVFNSIVLTPDGPLPTSMYLFEDLLKDFSVRILDSPARQLPLVNSRLLRITPKLSSLLLIFAASEAGKTSLARDFKLADRHAHVANDCVFVELVRLKKLGQTSRLPPRIAALIGEGGASECGEFNRAVEADEDLLGEYLSVVNTLIPVGKRLVTIDLDLRREDRYAIAKQFFADAGYSVWTVTR